MTEPHIEALTTVHIRTMRADAIKAGEQEVAELCDRAIEGNEQAREQVADLCAGIDGWGGDLGWHNDHTHPCYIAYELENERHQEEMLNDLASVVAWDDR